MRILTTLGVFFIGSIALACPNLGGTFQCTNSDGSVDTTTIEQRNVGGATVYVVEGEEYVADGQAYQYSKDEDGLTIHGANMTLCQNNNVQIYDQGVLYYGQQQVGNYDTLSEVIPNGSGFTVNTNGYVEAGGDKQIIDESSNCSRM